jgi:hypothetical protein
LAQDAEENERSKTPGRTNAVANYAAGDTPEQHPGVLQEIVPESERLITVKDLAQQLVYG